MSVNLSDLIAAHRALDDLLGRFLAAASAGQLDAARQSIAEFDAALRRHMADEEDRLFAPPPERRLVPPEDETDSARLSRELRLEHVQIRELSGMMLRLVVENGDLTGAQRLFGNLARRWDAHTAKEERELGRP